MANPHFEIKITKRSKRQSAVAGAAYQSGENLFSEYDQKHKDYRKKEGVVYTEIMLPSHAPPEYADREQLWNAVEAVENQWNSQLARRFVLALPREVPEEFYPQMVQDYCNQFFVSKGMIVDFAIHDPKPPGHNLSNPRYFRSPYGRQKGWERIQPDNGGGDFQELTPEEVEQLELPPEWLK